jgi:serine/threonine-protein kinase RsbW
VNCTAELRLNRTATSDASRPLRHALSAFIDAAQIDPDRRDDIVLAVGEALANAVEHAYDDRPPGLVELYACTDDQRTLTVDVVDDGRFIEREGTPGRGFGMRIMRAIARAVSVDVAGGTRVRMVFDAPRSGPPFV